MCNHYVIKNDIGVLEFAMRWELEDIRDEEADNSPWEPQAHAYPWADVRMPVVYEIEGGATLGFMRWGVWPFYAKTIPRPPIANARDDALLKSAAWKSSAANRRCLIPADGFFEWTGPKGAKWEVMFQLPDEEPFFFAGIWSRDPVGKGRGFAIVTGKPNAQIASLPHDRMPVILDHDGAEAWLGREPLPGDQLLGLCRPYPGEFVHVDLPRLTADKPTLARVDLFGSEI